MTPSGRAGQQRASVREHERIVVDVDDPGRRGDRLGDLVGVVRRRQSGADIEELPDADRSRGQVAVTARPKNPGWPGADRIAGRPPRSRDRPRDRRRNCPCPPASSRRRVPSALPDVSNAGASPPESVSGDTLLVTLLPFPPHTGPSRFRVRTAISSSHPSLSRQLRHCRGPSLRGAGIPGSAPAGARQDRQVPVSYPRVPCPA